MKRYAPVCVAVLAIITFFGLRQFVYAPVSAPNEFSPNHVSFSLGETRKVGAFSITPIEVLEDSRCPINVTCIWAGHVRVRAKIASALGESEGIFITTIPITVEGQDITLTEVSPAARAGQTISPQDYRFTVTIEKTAP